MATVHDVAAYILAKAAPMSAMKLQKLCYFSYGYHLAWEDRPLFGERFEAWANGPVVYELYAQHRGRFHLHQDDIRGEPSALDSNELESVNIVLDSFSAYSAHELSTMSHLADSPWDQARRRAGAQDLQRSNEELSDADIADFFGALVDREG